MNNKMQEVRILLVNDRPEDSERIKQHLNKHMRLPWNLSHCVNLKEAGARVTSTDIVILELELEGLKSPRQIFGAVEHMAFEVPIIALTSKDKAGHGLATYVMEMGAADTIIRGQFGRLVDAIEFALIRQQITTEARKASDRAMIDNKKQADESLEKSKEQSAVDLQESNTARADDKEKSRQILRMFMGDYSVDEKSNN